MTVIFECSRPAVWPFAYKSRTMYRFGAAWFGISVLRIPLKEFAETSYRWRMEGWDGA
jgi:hypothetical protein